MTISGAPMNHAIALPRIRRIVQFSLIIMSWSNGPLTATPSACTEDVLTQALQVWSLINVARSVFRDCAEAALLGAPRLMRSIGTLWEGYKETVAYPLEEEDMIGTLMERIL
jgi:hypothetical protein